MTHNGPEADFVGYARTRGFGGVRCRELSAFRELVGKLNRKQRAGSRLDADDYVELSISGARMYTSGRRSAFPPEVRAAVELELDLDDHVITSG